MDQPRRNANDVYSPPVSREGRIRTAAGSPPAIDVPGFLKNKTAEGLDQLEHDLQAQRSAHGSSAELDQIEHDLVRMRAINDQMTDRAIGIETDPLLEIAERIAKLPLGIMRRWGDQVVKLHDYKAPTTPLEFAVALNDWAEKSIRSEPRDGSRQAAEPVSDKA